MDPAMPDWRAFGQPVAVTAATSVEPARSRSPFQFLDGLSRTARIGLAVAAATAVCGIALALLTPGGGGLSIEDGTTATAASFTDPAGDIPGDVLTGRAGTPADAELVVDVAGAVVRPGLVRLAAGSRVGDALAAAGGYAPDADLHAVASELNLAAPLEDGTKVLVAALAPASVATPGLEGAAAAAEGAGDGGGGGGRVDLNTATGSELEALPGIGPVTAGRILEARAEAPFTSVDELRARGLVGESTFGRLRDLVTARP